MKHKVNQFHRSWSSYPRSCRTLYSRTSSVGINQGSASTSSVCMPLRKWSYRSTSGMLDIRPLSGSLTCTDSTREKLRRMWELHFIIHTLARMALTLQPWPKGVKNKISKRLAKIETAIPTNRAKLCNMNLKVRHRHIKTA